MKVFTQKSDLLEFVTTESKKNSIGFVPTMGALHMGHFSLFEKCRAENQICIASIFVNPLQFNNKEDYEKYPRTVDADILILEKANFDAVFIPEAESFYKDEVLPDVNLGSLVATMEGKFRPGHFEGVYQVVNLLFKYAQPHFAYFGQKDFQQIAVIRHMVKTEGHKTQVIASPTIREANGLAMSSRNTRLSPEEFEKAAKVSKFLLNLNHTIPVNASDLKEEFNALTHSLGFTPEYIEMSNPDTLEPIEIRTNQAAVICIAYQTSTVRLIDNVIWTAN